MKDRGTLDSEIQDSRTWDNNTWDSIMHENGIKVLKHGTAGQNRGPQDSTLHYGEQTEARDTQCLSGHSDR